MVYRCLRKKPEERFANGMELHHFIASNSVSSYRSQFDSAPADGWQYQAEKLLKEKQQLQQQLAAKEAELQRLQTTAPLSGAERYPGQDDYAGNTRKNTAWIVAFLITLLLAAGLAYALIQSGKKEAETEPKATEQPARTPIGDFRVNADQTNFHNEPNDATRRNAFLLRNALLTGS